MRLLKQLSLLPSVRFALSLRLALLFFFLRTLDLIFYKAARHQDYWIDISLHMAEALDSTISINSPDSQPEDWDRSIVLSDSDALLNSETQENGPHTPRNSIAFPSNGGSTPGRQRRNTNPTTEWASTTKTGRSLSELMKLHSEKGTRCEFSADEALRVADVLGQWVRTFLLFWRAIWPYRYIFLLENCFDASLLTTYYLDQLFIVSIWGRRRLFCRITGWSVYCFQTQSKTGRPRSRA